MCWSRRVGYALHVDAGSSLPTTSVEGSDPKLCVIEVASAAVSELVQAPVKKARAHQEFPLPRLKKPTKPPADLVNPSLLRRGKRESRAFLLLRKNWSPLKNHLRRLLKSASQIGGLKLLIATMTSSSPAPIQPRPQSGVVIRDRESAKQTTKSIPQ